MKHTSEHGREALYHLRQPCACGSKKLWIEYLIAKKLNWKKDILFTEHHYAHAASAYYSSDFDDAVVVTMDGVGEWDTTTIGYAKGNNLRLTHTIHFPDSIGLLYSALTYYLGFKVNSAEYKVMGLAPYGNPDTYYPHFKKLIEIRRDGSFQLDRKYFSYEYGNTMTNRRFHDLFGGPPRARDGALDQRHKDIAAALQKITDEVVCAIVSYAKSLYPSDNLCVAGGVALNCVANGKILEKGLFKHLYVQPAAGDAGGSVGAAPYVYFEMLKNPKKHDVMETAYLGPSFSNDDIRAFLAEESRRLSTTIHYEFLPEEELIRRVGELIEKNFVIGVFAGRMEFGPRALRNRSILADPRKKENWQ